MNTIDSPPGVSDYSKFIPPTLIICVSGKRKSGKDFASGRLRDLLTRRLSDQLAERLSKKILTISVCGISYLLKEEFAKMHQMDAEILKTDNVYKESVRLEMVKYGEEIRAKDSGFFCRSALESVCDPIEGTSQDVNEQLLHIVIISDCRRPTDLAYFRACKTNIPPIFVRVNASVEVRKSRGFEYTPGIDDGETECALDSFDAWDFYLQNGGDSETLDADLAAISNVISSKLFRD